MFLISGLDLVIVGHYDYQHTGFYAVASSVTNFMLLVVGSIFGPILPAVSSIQAGSTPAQIGDLVVKVTRYCTLRALPAWVAASVWGVSITLALGGAQVCHPKCVLPGDSGSRQCDSASHLSVCPGCRGHRKQHLATMGAIAEAVVNIVVSVLLVTRIGAVGVAIGTLAGAFVSLGMHVAVSMPFTQSTIQIQRWRFVMGGLARPLLSLTPSLFLIPFWRRSDMLPANPVWLATWAILTLVIALRRCSDLRRASRPHEHDLSAAILEESGTNLDLPSLALSSQLCPP